MMMKININKLSRIGIVAALYTVLTVFIAPLSYGPIQFRFSEILTLLAFIDPLYIPGLVLGCIISNFFSPLGIVDVIIGSFATYLSVYLISKSKSLFIASLWPTIFNGIIIGLELYFLVNAPLWITTLQVAFGEFVVVTLIGYPLFKNILKNSKLVSMLKIDESSTFIEQKLNKDK
jgi:uncharacterized membrane protein